MTPLVGHPLAMLTEIYIEAVDEELADRVWEAWGAGRIFDFAAAFMWLWITYNGD